jgi:hypothetical protein
MPKKSTPKTDDEGGGDRKAKVTDQHRAEAAALKALFDEAQEAAKAKKVRFTQGGFGEDYGIGDAALVWQYLNARIPLNLRVAVAFAKGLGCEISSFSARLAAEAAALTGIPAKAGEKPIAILSFLDLDRTEAQLVATFRDLNEEQRAALLRHADQLHNETHPDPSPANTYGNTKRARA